MVLVSARGQVVREHGEEAVLAALVLWLRARRWPLIPLRYYHRATSSQTSTEPPALQQLLGRLPTRCAEQVSVVAREACQLIYLAPGVAGSGVEAMASILAPVRTLRLGTYTWNARGGVSWPILRSETWKLL